MVVKETRGTKTSTKPKTTISTKVDDMVPSEAITKTSVKVDDMMVKETIGTKTSPKPKMTIGTKAGRKPKQYSDNNGTPSSEGTNLGDIPSLEGTNLQDMAFAQAVSAPRSNDSDESSTLDTETESSHTELSSTTEEKYTTEDNSVANSIVNP